MPTRFAVLGLLLLAPSLIAGTPGTRAKALASSRLTKLRSMSGGPEVRPGAGVFSTDGARALFRYEDAAPEPKKRGDTYLALWDVPGSRVLKTISLGKDWCYAWAFLPDRQRAVAALFDPEQKKPHSRLVVWDLDSGKLLRTLPAQPGVVTCLALADDGKIAFTGDAQGVCRWSLDTGKVARVWKQPQEGLLLAVALLPGGRRALISSDSQLTLIDLEKGRRVRDLAGHSDLVLAVALSRSGKRAASVDVTGKLCLWDLDAGKRLGAGQPGPQSVETAHLVFAGNESLVLALLMGGETSDPQPSAGWLGLCDGAAGTARWHKRVPVRQGSPLALIDDGKRALIGGGANVFGLLDAATGRAVKLWGGHKGPVAALAAAPKRLYSAGQEGTIIVWEGGTIRTQLLAHHGPVDALALSPDARTLLSSAGRTIKVWDTQTLMVRQVLKGHEGSVVSLAFDPKGRWACSASTDRTVRTWNLTTGKQLDTFTGHADAVNGIAAAPDGCWLASASDDETVRLWPVRDGKADLDRSAITLEGHTRQVTCVSFTPDGKEVVSGSQDGTLRLHDVTGASEPRVFKGHTNWINAVRFVRPGLLASSSDDLTVRLWDARRGKEVDRLELAHIADSPRGLAAAEPGTLAVGTAGWLVLVFDVLPGAPLKKR